MTDANLSADGTTLIVVVPISFQKRGGRKLIVAPDGANSWAQPRPRADTTMIKALARAHRWKNLLESGRFNTVQDLADAEKINPSYLSRILRLTLLAPDIVEMILDGRQPAAMQLDDLLRPFPVEWRGQKKYRSS